MRERQKDDLLIDCGLAFAGAEYSAQHDAEEEIKEQNNDQPLTLHAHRRDEFSLDQAEEHRRHHERGQKRNAYDLTLCPLFRRAVLTLSRNFRGWRIHGVLCHVCGALGYNPGMPPQRHYYGLNHLHFITASTYRRARLFDSDRFRRQFAGGAYMACCAMCAGLWATIPACLPSGITTG
jgi:hypothetical protein